MARPLRLEYPGALYHVCSRGHERGGIFRDDADRNGFLKMLARVVEEHGWIVHSYCLMGNHYHLLLETPSANLAAGMRKVNGWYTQKFNRRHRRSGHLFEGRYKSVLVQKEAHLLELCRYLVLNPVRAGMVKSPGDWPWSNFRATSGGAEKPEWLETDWTLAQFARGRNAAGRAYRRFVMAGKGLVSPLKAVRRQIYLGDDGFLKEMRRRLDDREPDTEIPVSQRRPWSVGLEDVRRAVAKSFDVPDSALSRRRGGDEKVAAIYLARKLTGLTGAQIGAAFGVKPARVSNAVRDVEEGERARLRPRLDRIRARLLRA